MSGSTGNTTGHQKCWSLCKNLLNCKYWQEIQIAWNALWANSVSAQHLYHRLCLWPVAAHHRSTIRLPKEGHSKWVRRAGHGNKNRLPNPGLHRLNHVPRAPTGSCSSFACLCCGLVRYHGRAQQVSWWYSQPHLLPAACIFAVHKPPSHVQWPWCNPTQHIWTLKLCGWNPKTTWRRRAVSSQGSPAVVWPFLGCQVCDPPGG